MNVKYLLAWMSCFSGMILIHASEKRMTRSEKQQLTHEKKQKNALAIVLKSAQDVPSMCVALAEKLSQKKPFCGSGSYGSGIHSGKTRVLPLDFARAYLCELLDMNAERLFGKGRCWEISSFGLGVTRLYTHQWKAIDSGMMQKVQPSMRLCDSSVLKEAYRKVMDKVMQGWEYHIDAYHDEICLIKRNTEMLHEYSIVNHIASVCGIDNEVYSLGPLETGKNLPAGCISLWIKKDSYETVKSIFSFV